jgi:predicted kinase
MRKWQRGRKKGRTNSSAPAGDQPAPLRPTYPEIQEELPDRIEHAPEPVPEAAATSAQPAPQRRKRGGRRKKKPATGQPVAEQADATPPPETADAGLAAPPRKGVRRRRGGARKPAPAAESATAAAPPEPLPEIPPLPAEEPAQLESAWEPATQEQEVEVQVEEPAPESYVEAEVSPEVGPPPEPVPQAAPSGVTAFPPELKPAAAPAQPQRRPKGVVVLAIGLPGSGKTTWFKRRGVTPLSSDLLRTILFDNITEQRYQNLVFGTLRSLLRARLIARMPWNYVDATNLSPRERRHWIQMSRSFGFEVHAVFFDVPLEVCLERNRKRQRIVPEEVMHRMAAKLRAPRFDEGFAKITVVRIRKRPQP